MHLPWCHWPSVEKVYKIIACEKPDVIIQLGDLYDFFAFSRFSRHQDVMTPKEEIEDGRQAALGFWDHLNIISPDSRKIQIKGNHCDRLLNRVMDRFPEVYSIVEKAEANLFKFKNVETIQNSRDELMIENVIYTHGWLGKVGDHAKYFGKSVVRGHSHKLECAHFNFAGGRIFEVACGFLADEAQHPLQYGSTKTTNWVLGCVVIDPMGIRLISL